MHAQLGGLSGALHHQQATMYYLKKPDMDPYALSLCSLPVFSLSVPALFPPPSLAPPLPPPVFPSNKALKLILGSAVARDSSTNQPVPFILSDTTIHTIAIELDTISGFRYPLDASRHSLYG